MNQNQKLADSAARDLDLLKKSRGYGDLADVARDVDFYFYGPDESRAKAFARLVGMNHYGRSKCELTDGKFGPNRWLVLVTMHIPATDSVVCSASGLFVCLAEAHGLDYDGWESPVVRKR